MIKKVFLIFSVFLLLGGIFIGGWQTGNAVKVMTVPSDAVAYDFSVIALNPNWPYLALFHAEPYLKNGCWGDSVAGRYGNIPWNPLGYNRFGTHNKDQDMLITRSISAAHDSEYMESNGCQEASGAANPIMIYNGVNAWGIYYLSLRKEADKWRHYLMVAMVDPSHMHDVHSAGMWYFGRVNKPVCVPNQPCYPGENWFNEQPQGGLAALVGKNLKFARPVAEEGTGNRVMSACAYPQKDWSQGLLGSITANHNYTKFYYYYTDIVKVGTQYELQLLRRTMNSTLTSFSAPKKLKVLCTNCCLDKWWFWIPVVKVNYHSTKKKYVVMYSCGDQTRPHNPDIGIQLADDPDLTGVTLARYDSPTYGIKVYNDPNIPKDGNGYYAISQFNVKKDGWGHHFSAGGSTYDIIVYMPVNPGTNVGPYGVSIYGKGVNL